MSESSLPPDLAARTARVSQGIPLLRSEEMSADLVAIRTWQEALSDALSEEVPHDLFALWLFPPGGSPVLVGPEALAEDQLVIPHPAPTLDEKQLAVLEEIVRDAGYKSAKCLAIPHGQADVGLLLLADLRPGLYGAIPMALLEAAVRSIAPMLGRLVRRWPTADVESAESELTVVGHRPPARVRGDAARFDALLAGLGQASTGAGTPRDFLLAVSYTLQPLLPHDIIELLVPDATGERHYRLGNHGFGPLWADPALVVEADAFDPLGLFQERGSVLVADTRGTSLERWALGGPLGEPRSVIAVKLRVLERTVGYLLLGSLGEDFYEAEDLDLLDHVGALITARVDAFVLLWHQQVLRTNLGLLRSLPVQLGKMGDTLATIPLLGEGTRLFARQLGGLLPAKRIEFALKLGDEARVAIVEPGDTTALADLPQRPIAGTLVGDVIKGTSPYVLTEQELGSGPESVIVVPLRAGGNVFGAMAITGSVEVFTRGDIPLAQQLADLIAPHFDILRRSGAMPPPFSPGWKRAPRF